MRAARTSSSSARWCGCSAVRHQQSIGAYGDVLGRLDVRALVQPQECEELPVVGRRLVDEERVEPRLRHRLAEDAEPRQGVQHPVVVVAPRASSRQRQEGARDVLAAWQAWPQEERVLLPAVDAEVGTRLEVEHSATGDVGGIVAHHRPAGELQGEPPRHVDIEPLLEEPVSRGRALRHRAAQLLGGPTRVEPHACPARAWRSPPLSPWRSRGPPGRPPGPPYAGSRLRPAGVASRCAFFSRGNAGWRGAGSRAIRPLGRTRWCPARGRPPRGGR